PQGVTLHHRRSESYEEVAHWWMDTVLSIAEAECLALRQDALRAVHRLSQGEAAMRPGSAALRQLIVEAESAGQRYLEQGHGLMQACLTAEQDLIAAQVQPKERPIPAWMSDILDARKAAESTV